MVIALTAAFALWCLIALFAVALMRVAARADEMDAEHAQQTRLRRLDAVRSPTGKRFFAGPGAAQELDEELTTLSGAAGR